METIAAWISKKKVSKEFLLLLGLMPSSCYEEAGTTFALIFYYFTLWMVLPLANS